MVTTQDTGPKNKTVIVDRPFSEFKDGKKNKHRPEKGKVVKATLPSQLANEVVASHKAHFASEKVEVKEK